MNSLNSSDIQLNITNNYTSTRTLATHSNDLPRHTVDVYVVPNINFLATLWHPEFVKYCNIAGNFSTLIVVSYVYINFNGVSLSCQEIVRTLDPGVIAMKYDIPGKYLAHDSVTYKILFSQIAGLVWKYYVSQVIEGDAEAVTLVSQAEPTFKIFHNSATIADINKHNPYRKG